MKIGRAAIDGTVESGTIEDGTFVTDDGEYPIGDDGAELRAPCQPSALYCIGRNYTETIEQMDYDLPDTPTFFIKPPVSVIPHGEPIPYPSFSEEVTYAGELAAVIGERCHNLDRDGVESVIRGYTIMNDVDALDQNNLPARKAFNGSGPLGPWIETDIDPHEIDMRTTINGEERQRANTELMIFDPYELVAFLSQRFTLHPGDVIAFGSPANPGLIEPGDEIEITYEGVGTLVNGVSEPN